MTFRGYGHFVAYRVSGIGRLFSQPSTNLKVESKMWAWNCFQANNRRHDRLFCVSWTNSIWSCFSTLLLCLDSVSLSLWVSRHFAKAIINYFHIYIFLLYLWTIFHFFISPLRGFCFFKQLPLLWALPTFSWSFHLARCSVWAV
jgi:hypothetical protein